MNLGKNKSTLINWGQFKKRSEARICFRKKKEGKTPKKEGKKKSNRGTKKTKV